MSSFNNITEVLQTIKSLSEPLATVYMQDEPKTATPPFVVVENGALGSDDLINNFGSIDTESFIIRCYGLNRPLSKDLATQIRDKLRFEKTPSGLLFQQTELTDGTVRLQDDLFQQQVRLKVRIPN